VDDVMSSHKKVNEPESKTTSMRRPIRQVAAPLGRYSTFLVDFASWLHRGEIIGASEP